MDCFFEERGGLVVIQNKKEPKKGTKCFAISMGGGGVLKEGVSMVYGVCV